MRLEELLMEIEEKWHKESQELMIKIVSLLQPTQGPAPAPLHAFTQPPYGYHPMYRPFNPDQDQ